MIYSSERKLENKKKKEWKKKAQGAQCDANLGFIIVRLMLSSLTKKEYNEVDCVNFSLFLFGDELKIILLSYPEVECSMQ